MINTNLSIKKVGTFPRLMINSVDQIVLFTDYKVGTLIHDNHLKNIGHHSTIWSMAHFEPYDKPITLENV